MISGEIFLVMAALPQKSLPLENHASSPSWRGRIKESPWTWLAGITLLSVALVMAGQAVMPKGKMFPDYITYWTAGKLVASGQSPYDVDRQIEIQRDLGWDRSINGRGVLDFLPYYYPPWFALGCTLLVPLGFEGGKLAWFFLNLELLFLDGLRAQRRRARRAAIDRPGGRPAGLVLGGGPARGADDHPDLVPDGPGLEAAGRPPRSGRGSCAGLPDDQAPVGRGPRPGAGHLGGPPASLECRLWVRRDPRLALFGQ